MTVESRGHALQLALESVAHWVSANELELGEALRASKQGELADELRQAMDGWRLASQEYSAAVWEEARYRRMGGGPLNDPPRP